MPVSLFIERHPTGFAFYINGDLQFDTADEAIYHEYLVIPTIALAVQRFPYTQLRVLICGGGDGLAARDALRFPEVSEVTLVDFNPDVLELARTIFRPYNQGSLVEAGDTALGANRVNVYTQEAFQFVSALPDACYHVVICDFTCPTSLEESQVYSREWFQQVRRVLCPNGVMSTNGVSPEATTLGFWCLYQTILAAGFYTKPMQISIPSFHRHDYGDWGFMLASTAPIVRSELETIQFPENLREIQTETWLDAFLIAEKIANHRHTVYIDTLNYPHLFYYLLNPEVSIESPEFTPDSIHPNINFLDIQENGTGLTRLFDPLQLESIAKKWLDQLNQSDTRQISLENHHLIPAQHYYHEPRMTQEWLGYLRSLLHEIDANQFVPKLLDRAQELPPQLTRELKQLLTKVRTGQPLTYLSKHTTELITVLSITLIMANLAAPDSVFAKGFSSFSGRSRGGYSSGGSYSNTGYYDSGDDQLGPLGFWLMIIGGFWLWSLYRNQDND
jgi:spermidine synthase